MNAANGLTRFVVSTLSLVFVFLMVPAQIPSQAPARQTFRFDARLGFESFVVPQCWNPLFVDADPSMEGLRIEVSHGAAVEVFTNIDSKTLEIPVYADENNQTVDVRWFLDQTLLGSRRVRVFEKAFPGNLVLGVAIPPSADTMVPGLLLPVEPVRLAHARVKDLPSRGFDYDPVRVLVLEDQGPLLSAAQRNALGNWLRAGGRLVVLAAKQGAAGILSQISDVGPVAEVSGRLGLGMVSAYREDGSDWDRGKWKSALGLEPFENGGALISSQAFPKTLVSSLTAGDFASRPGPRIALVAGVFLWAGGLFGLRYLRRLRLTALAVWTVAWLVGVLILAPAIEWDRGYQSRIRIIQAPGSQAALADLEIWLPSSRVESGLAMDSSPWGLELSGPGGDTATLGASLSAPRLVHGPGRDGFSLRAGRSGYLRVEAWIDSDSLAKPRVLHRPDSGTQTSADEREWVSDLMRRGPDIAWKLGTAEGLPIRISGLRARDAVYLSAGDPSAAPGGEARQ